MSAIRPVVRDPLQGPGEVSAGPGQLAGPIREKLDDIEGRLRDMNPRDAEPIRGLVAELRALADGLSGPDSEQVEAEIADRTSELASFSNFLQTQSEREKALLARELHDSLGGILTPAKMDLAWLEARLGDDPEYGQRLRRLGALIDQGIDLKRRIIENLRPSLLDHLGLASALQWYMDEAARTAGIDCDLHIGDNVERLPADMEIALYRLVQESVNNIVKHANARRISLALQREAHGLRLTVADDGVGIADLERAKKLSHGMAGMMHRVRSVNGTFDVRSKPGEGTRIEVFVPLQKK